MRNAGYVMFDVMVPYKAGSRAILRSPVYESILLAQKLLCSAIVGGGPDLDLPERRCLCALESAALSEWSDKIQSFAGVNATDSVERGDVKSPWSVRGAAHSPVYYI